MKFSSNRNWTDWLCYGQSALYLVLFFSFAFFSLSKVKGQTLCEEFGNMEINLTLGAGTSITHTSQIGPVYTGNVFIQGDLIVDNGFTFLNSKVKIAPGVTIFVQIPNTPFVKFGLTLDNSKLFACNDLWQGIVLSQSVNVQTRNGTEIEDAEKAIIAEGTGPNYLSITQTTFNRNRIGISLMSSAGAINGPVFIKFSSNLFDCDAPLNGTSDEISLAGIQSINVPVIAHPNTLPSSNRFMQLKNGIIAEGENTIVQGRFFTFENIEKDGIFLEKGTIKLDFSTFTNCGEKGINLLFAHELRLTGCSFNFDEDLPETTADGVFVGAYGVGSYCGVAACSFNADLTSDSKEVRGLHFKGGNVGDGTNIVVSGTCRWNFTALSSEGIYLPGVFPSGSKIEIFDNIFDIKLPEAGSITYAIRATGGTKDDLDIIGNIFTNDASTSGWPIAVSLNGSEGTDCQVSDNDFPPPVIFYSFLAGIEAVNFKNTKFCSNVFFNTSRAFIFAGENDNTDLVANDCNVGTLVTIYGPAWIDDQEHKGNTWSAVPGFPFVADPQAEMDFPDFADFSKFEVHTPQSTTHSGPGFSPYHPKDIEPDVDNEWWDMGSGTPESTCVDEFTGGGGTSRLKKDIADGLIGNVLGSPSLEWQAERGLYRTLMQNPDMINLYPSFSSFVTANSNTTIGQLYNISVAIENALAADSLLLTSVEGKQSEIATLIGELATIDSILETSTDTTEIESATTAKSNKTNGLINALSAISTYNQTYSANVINEVGNIKPMNNNISTSTEWASDEKTVNGIYLDYLETGVLDGGQIGTLTPIAQKCPKISGMAVYIARGLLPDHIQSSISDDYAGCYPSPTEPNLVSINPLQRPSNPSGNTVFHETSIYPNPTKGELKVKLPKGEVADLTVTNSLGHTVTTRRSIQSFQKVDLSSFTPGIYIIQLTFKDGLVSNHTLIIEK